MCAGELIFDAAGERLDGWLEINPRAGFSALGGLTPTISALLYRRLWRWVTNSKNSPRQVAGIVRRSQKAIRLSIRGHYIIIEGRSDDRWFCVSVSGKEAFLLR